MNNILEVLTLLRRQAELELNLLNGNGTAVATEQELEATRRRLVAHPQALSAVLQTARALRRTPDALSTQDVTDWSSPKDLGNVWHA